MHRRSSVVSNKVPNGHNKNNKNDEELQRIVTKDSDSPSAKTKGRSSSSSNSGSHRSSGSRFVWYYLIQTLILVSVFGMGWVSRGWLQQRDDRLRQEQPSSSPKDEAVMLPPSAPQQSEIQRVQIIRRDGQPNEPTKVVSSRPPDGTPPNTFFDSDSDVPSRVFQVYPYDFPCIEFDGLKQRSPSTDGFLYIKEMKASSTTLAGVALRISRNVFAAAQQQQQQETNGDTNGYCKVRYAHVRARKFGKRIVSKSFLWSFVREPNARMVSKFFHFAVSRAGYPITNFTEYYHEYDHWIYDQGYYMKTLAVREGVHPRDPPYYRNETYDLLQDYDFLGVTERMDESLAVLQLLLKRTTGDMLYLNVKEQNSYEWFGGHCNRFQPTVVSDELQTYLESKEWKEYTAVDRLIYRSVNKSLDRTIESLGRDVVNREMRKLRFAQSIVKERCKPPTVLFPCSSDGVDQRDKSTCLDGDIGCGHDCLDQIAKELPNMPEFQSL